MKSSELQRLDRLHALVHRFPYRLDGLIATVHARGGDDALERLSSAAAVADEVNQLSDSLVGYFVDAARRAGHPWSQIGMALGVSRQAAQQRFVGPDFSRYTDRARRVIDSAAHAARRLGHSWVATEHILIGLAEISDSVAAEALMSSAGITSEMLQAELSELVTAVEGPPSDTAPLGRGAAKLLGELAPAEALTLGHNYVGPEHVLLALLRQPEGLAGTLLDALSVDIDQLRGRILELLSHVEPINPR